MPNVTLLRPVVHDGEKFVAGEVIADLTEKAAKRLVRLGVAIMGAVVNDADTPPPVLGLSPEKEALIKKMKKKSEVLTALVDAGVDASEDEKLQDLKQKLSEAWSEPISSDAPALSAEESEEIDNMTVEEILPLLASVDIPASDQETVEELRAKLKAAWSADMKAGG